MNGYFIICCNKFEIFDHKQFVRLSENCFYTILKYLTITLIWYLIYENPITRTEMVFTYEISTSLVDIGLNLVPSIKIYYLHNFLFIHQLQKLKKHRLIICGTITPCHFYDISQIKNITTMSYYSDKQTTNEK